MWTDVLTPLRWLLRGSLFLLHATVLLLPCLFLLRFGQRCELRGQTLATRALTFWSRCAAVVFARPRMVEMSSSSASVGM